MEDNFEELQAVVLATVLRDPYILARVKDDIKAQYFTKLAHKVIYKSALYFYNRYGKLPGETELILVIKDLLTDGICSVDEIRGELRALYSMPFSSLEFAADQVARFVKRRRLENALKEFIPKIRDGNTLCIDELGERLSESVTLNLRSSRAFQLADTEFLEDVRLAAVGSDENPTVIKSAVGSINDSLLAKGYTSGDVVIVVAKPGCFAGDTKVKLSDGTADTLENLCGKKPGIVGYDFRTHSFEEGCCENVIVTKHVSRLVEIEFDNKGKVRCTDDHRFLAGHPDIGTVWLKAGKLSEGMRVKSDNGDGYVTIASIKEVRYKDKVPVYDIAESSVCSNFVVCLDDGTGIVAHNCGKTMFMVNELANAARQGHNALHLFIGDMTEYDGLVRYLSNISGVQQDTIAGMNLGSQKDLVSRINAESDVLRRIVVKSYAASEISVEQMIEDVFKIQGDTGLHFDIIAADYPDNLTKHQDTMYESGGDIYNRLSYLARRNSCVILAGSQPKISNWNDEIIPLSGCAESSKKQHIADLIIALGRPSNDSKLLTGFLAKVRRGTMGTIFRLKTEFERARLRMISEFDYIQEKADTISHRKKDGGQQA